MKRNWGFYLLVCFLTIFSFHVFLTHSANAVTHLRIASSSMGGTWFPISAGISGIINNQIQGVMSAPTLGGGVENIKSIEKGDVEMAVTIGSTAFEAWNGLNWAKDKKYREFRALLNMYGSGLQFVVAKQSDIFTLKDLVGKRFVPGKVGWTAEVLAREMLKFYGITYEDILKKGGKIIYGGFEEMTMLMKDKHADCVSATSPAPTSWILDISTGFPIRLIPSPDEVLKYMTEKYGTGRYTVKAGSYKGVDKEVQCLGVANIMVIHKKFPEDLVYKITKAIWDNLDSLKKVHPVVEQEMNLSNALSGFSIPLHKGAAKYYQEKGLAIPIGAKPID